MPELRWDQTAFFEILGVVPEAEEYGVSYHYAVVQGPVRLELTVWPLSSDIHVSLWLEGSNLPLIELKLIECPGVRVVHDKRGHFIEFSAGNIFYYRYDGESPLPYGFRLWVSPQLRLEPFAYLI